MASTRTRKYAAAEESSGGSGGSSREEGNVAKKGKKKSSSRDNVAAIKTEYEADTDDDTPTVNKTDRMDLKVKIKSEYEYDTDDDAGARVDGIKISQGNDAKKKIEDDTQILMMTQRENDFNEKTWWMVDLNPIGETSSLQGASALVKRCMRLNGWDELEAKKILVAYRHFMSLKKEMKDWDAKALSPCYLVEQMWHCHASDVVNYCHDMMLPCGHVVGRI